MDLINHTFGYLVAFLGSVIGTATLFFPLPVDGMVFVLGGVLNPWILGFVAGIGMSIGELSGYLIGYFGREILEKKRSSEKLEKAQEIFKKYGFFAIPLASFTPFPFDIIGILCGTLKYDVKKFFLGTLIGKLPRALILSLAGAYALEGLVWFVKTIGWL